MLRQQRYHQQSRAERRYLEKMTGLSRAQVTRLIARYRDQDSVQPAPYKRHRFPQRYTRADVELLAAVDEAHETLSGPATRRILQREYQQYGKPEYQRLASISVAHLYNLRRRPRYRQRRLNYTKTRPTAVSIAERRRPDPQGRPGFLRVDTVHQGDRDSAKGVYHINAVDQVTQWQIVAAVPHISEIWLEPVLEAMLRQFPFFILGFHSDNGSEFINRTVACLLEKLRIQQTKSRPRRSNDNPYLNYHRPCAQADIEIDDQGRRRFRYQRYQTPLETLLALPNPGQYLRPGLSLASLKRVAQAVSDTEAAQRLQQAKRKLFEQFHPTQLGRWK